LLNSQLTLSDGVDDYYYQSSLLALGVAYCKQAAYESPAAQLNTPTRTLSTSLYAGNDAPWYAKTQDSNYSFMVVNS